MACLAVFLSIGPLISVKRAADDDLDLVANMILFTESSSDFCISSGSIGGSKMELTGDLKKQVEQAKDKADAKKIIEEAGMRLNDEELALVVGGISDSGSAIIARDGRY